MEKSETVKTQHDTENGNPGSPRAQRRRRKIVLVLCAAFLLCAGYLVQNLRGADESASEKIPKSAEYVGTEKCLACHSTMEAAWSKNPHEKTGEKTADPALNGCEACHGPGNVHAQNGNKAFIVNPANQDKAKLNAICGKCHSDPKSLAPREWRNLDATAWRRTSHYRKDVLCAACHKIHGGAEKLLAAEPKALCRNCHTSVSKREGYTHAPVKQEMCLDCHNPHGEGPPHIVRRDIVETCVKCHNVASESALKKHGGFNVSGKNCVSCHDPHSENSAGKLIPANVHPPFKTGRCATCHQGAGAADPLALKKESKDLCTMCHGDKAAEFSEAKVPHFPVKEGLCAACHNPHVSKRKLLVKDRLDVLCVACHAKVDNQLSGMYEHPPVAAGECANCHKPHGGDKEKLLKEEPDGLCKKCHQDVKFSHPMVEQKKNPDFGPIVRCYTCHAVHGSDITKLLPWPETELCNKCHHKDVNEPVSPESEE